MEGTIPTGVRKLDEHLLGGGLRRGCLYLVFSSAGAGKTALATRFALSAAQADHRALYVSLEMGVHEMSVRLASADSGIEVARMHGQVDAEAANALGRLARLPLLLNDSAQVDLTDLTRQVRSHCAAGEPISLLVVDYAQLMGPDTGQTARSLKQLARAENVAVVLVSQLRERAASGGRIDLKQLFLGEGAVEQNVDVILGIETEPASLDLVGNLRPAQVHVLKNRMGETGSAPLVLDRACYTFRDS